MWVNKTTPLKIKTAQQRERTTQVPRKSGTETLKPGASKPLVFPVLCMTFVVQYHGIVLLCQKVIIPVVIHETFLKAFISMFTMYNKTYITDPNN